MADTARPARSEELVELAAVVRAHGLAGEVLLKPFNPASELWESFARVLLKRPSGELTEHRVARAHLHGAGVLLGLADVSDKDAADALRGALVCVRRCDLPAAEAGEYYLVDLVGLAARDVSGHELGQIARVIDYPSVSCLVVENDAGSVEVPNTDRYVLAIDLEGGSVTLDKLDELEVLRVAPPKERR